MRVTAVDESAKTVTVVRGTLITSHGRKIVASLTSSVVSESSALAVIFVHHAPGSESYHENSAVLVLDFFARCRIDKNGFASGTSRAISFATSRSLRSRSTP